MTFILTNPFQFYLSLSDSLCVFFYFTLQSLSIFCILCVSWEELNVTESNQQICDLYQSLIFEKQKHCGTL